MVAERDLAHERDLRMRHREQLRADFDPDNDPEPDNVPDDGFDPWPDTGFDLDGDDA